MYDISADFSWFWSQNSAYNGALKNLNIMWVEFWLGKQPESIYFLLIHTIYGLPLNSISSVEFNIHFLEFVITSFMPSNLVKISRFQILLILYDFQSSAISIKRGYFLSKFIYCEFKKSSTLFWHYLISNVEIKWKGFFFKFLWPSQNIWTLT